MPKISYHRLSRAFLRFRPASPDSRISPGRFRREANHKPDSAPIDAARLRLSAFFTASAFAGPASIARPAFHRA